MLSSRKWKAATKSAVDKTVWFAMVRKGENVEKGVLCTTFGAESVLEKESKVSILEKQEIAVSREPNNITKTTTPTMLKPEARVYFVNTLMRSMEVVKKELNSR